MLSCPLVSGRVPRLWPKFQMALLGDNTERRTVYFCLSLVLGRVVKRVEAISTFTYCVWHFFCCRSYMIFYSSCNFNTFLKIYFLVYSLPNFGMEDLICHIKFFFVTRDKKCAYWTFVPLSLPLSFSLSFCLCFFLPFLISSRPCISAECLHLQSCSLFNLCSSR